MATTIASFRLVDGPAESTITVVERDGSFIVERDGKPMVLHGWDRHGYLPAQDARFDSSERAVACALETSGWLHVVAPLADEVLAAH